MDYRDEAPELIRNFLSYHQTVKGHSQKTVDEYYLDLRMFFRYMKIWRNIVPRDTDISTISISDIDEEFIKSITISDVYAFAGFLSRDREQHQNSKSTKRGLGATARARKLSTLRSFYKYLSTKTDIMETNPLQDLDSPKIKKSLPRFLTLDESVQLLSSVDGKNKERDFCILTLFLNCGLRISELVGLNLTSIRADSITVLGKGSKERTVYLNDACADAINKYLEVRKNIASNTNALFLSNRRERISRSTVHNLVKKHLADAGLDSTHYSSHKLRHTAATLMLQNGVDVRTLQELLGHEHLNTTEIYTHVVDDSLRDAAKLNPLASYKNDDSKDKNNDEVP